MTPVPKECIDHYSLLQHNIEAKSSSFGDGLHEFKFRPCHLLEM